MDKKLQKIAEVYNSYQNGYIVEKIGKDNNDMRVLLKVRNGSLDYHKAIGFYEWVFNPEYSVCEFFTSDNYYKLFSMFVSSDDKYSFARTKSVEEIINFMYEERK